MTHKDVVCIIGHYAVASAASVVLKYREKRPASDHSRHFFREENRKLKP
jgi:hypothetical protein